MSSIGPKTENDGAFLAPPGIPLTERQSLCGDIDMVIDLNGGWHYNGSPIGRMELVKLFASVLKRDDDGGHWLITPVEACRISVVDTAFMGVELQVSGCRQKQELSVRTNLDELIPIDEKRPLIVMTDAKSGAPRPIVRLQNGLEARLTRPVFYELVELGVAGTGKQDHIYGVWSFGHFFALGDMQEGND